MWIAHDLLVIRQGLLFGAPLYTHSVIISCQLIHLISDMFLTYLSCHPQTIHKTIKYALLVALICPSNYCVTGITSMCVLFGSLVRIQQCLLSVLCSKFLPLLTRIMLAATDLRFNFTRNRSLFYTRPTFRSSQKMKNVKTADGSPSVGL